MKRPRRPLRRLSPGAAPARPRYLLGKAPTPHFRSLRAGFPLFLHLPSTPHPHSRSPSAAPLPRPRPEGSEPFRRRGCPTPQPRRGAGAPLRGAVLAAARGAAPGSGGGRREATLAAAAAAGRAGRQRDARRAAAAGGSGGGECGAGECGAGGSAVLRGGCSAPGRRWRLRSRLPAGMGRRSFPGTQSPGWRWLSWS